MHAEPAQMSRRDLLGRSAVLAFFAALGTAAAGMIHASNVAVHRPRVHERSSCSRWLGGHFATTSNASRPGLPSILSLDGSLSTILMPGFPEPTTV